MRTDGTAKDYTENYYQEAPSWSHNGRVLIFYRETKSDSKGKGHSAKLWSIDITGYNERQIQTRLTAQTHLVFIIIKVGYQTAKLAVFNYNLHLKDSYKFEILLKP